MSFTAVAFPALPLLVNIVLNHLDWQLHARGFHFVRYADDFVVICHSKIQAEGARCTWCGRSWPHSVCN